jgi:single-strand DNA-binding protein
MSGVNKVILVGRLGNDPELQSLPSGKEVCNVSIATNKKYKDASGEQQEKTTWHKLVFYGPIAKVLAEYKKKGDQIFVEGELSTRSYQTQAGDNREVTEIIVHDLQML